MVELGRIVVAQQPNSAVVALATAQDGVISRRQLLDVGCTAAAVKWWVKTGRLHRIHRGVYALGHPVVSLRGRWIAALLACGRGAVLSHRSAGVVRGVLDDDQLVIDITAPQGRGRLEGVRVHRGRREVTRVDGLPVTTIDQTLADLAAVLTDRELERALDAAIRNGHRIEPVHRRGKPGAAALSALARRERQAHTVTRSALEERFLKAIRKAQLPEPELNVRIEGFEVDAVWRAARVIVELDGARYHDQPGVRRADRRRDAHVTAAGWRVLRAGWHDVEDLTGTLARMFGCALSPPPTN